MAFSLFVELLNFRSLKTTAAPVQLHGPTGRAAAEGVR
jgi:hypothetical protein